MPRATPRRQARAAARRPPGAPASSRRRPARAVEGDAARGHRRPAARRRWPRSDADRRHVPVGGAAQQRGQAVEDATAALAAPSRDSSHSSVSRTRMSPSPRSSAATRVRPDSPRVTAAARSRRSSAMRSSRHRSRPAPTGTCGRGREGRGDRGPALTGSGARAASSASRSANGARPARVNSAATALARRGSTTRPVGRAAGLVGAQQAPPAAAVDAQDVAQSIPGSRRAVEHEGHEIGVGRCADTTTRTSSSARRGHRVMPHRRQPGGVVGGVGGRSSRWVSAMRPAPEPHGDARSRGGEAQQVGNGGHQGVGAAQDRSIERCGVGVMAARCPRRARAGTAHVGSVDGGPALARVLWTSRQPKIDSRSSTDDSRSAGCRRCWPLVTT